MNALLPAFRFPRSVFPLLLLFLQCAGVAQVDLGTRVSITTGNVRSTLDRTSNRVTSTVEVTITNVGDRAIEKPIQAPVFFTAESGNLDGLLVADAEGGLGVAPFQTFFFDLSAAIPTATFAPQQSVKFTLRFTPAKGARVSFRVAPVGVVNADPIVNAGGPYSAQAGQEIAFDASASADPENGALSFAWDFGDGSAPASGAQPRHTFATAGAVEVVLTVTDPKGGSKTVRLPVNIAPAEPFGLARIRSLDGAGLPLGGVTVSEELLGTTRTFATNGATGFASLGAGAGDYRWKFSKPGHLDVWRTAMLVLGQVAELPNPWLAKVADPVRLSPLADAPLTSSSVSIAFPGGAFTQPTDATLTDLNTQSLPFPLPVGWSPLAQFHLGAVSEPALPGVATIKLRGPLVADEQAAVVKYNAADSRWEVLALVAGTNSVVADVPSSGWYAVVVPDLGETAPPPAVAGQPLSASTSPTAIDGTSATGTVTPAVNAASLDAARVTANARVNFTRETPLPSGVFFRTRISETYTLNGGASARTPDYDATVFAYQRPGGLAAEFPLRPQLLFGPRDLVEANVHAEVLGAGAFSGGVLSPSGGTLSKDGVRVTTPVDGFDAPTAAELGTLGKTAFGTLPGGAVVEKAFSLSVAQLAAGKTLSFAFEALAPNSFFVLALAVSDEQGPGFTPLERFSSNAAGVLTSREPASGPRLPGANGPGDYVLLRVGLPVPGELVIGIARDASGQPTAGLAVRTDPGPWLVFSGADGSYATLGPAFGFVTVFDARDGNAGSTPLTTNLPVIDPRVADVSTAPTGPRVASTDPASEAMNVRTVAPIVVRFTEPISAASFGANGVRLRDTVANADVPAAISLDLANRVATLFPTNPLAGGRRHEIIVSSAIRDRQNLPIEGPLTFAFTTVPPDARPPGAQLTIFEPGAANVPQAVLDQLVGYTPGDTRNVVATGSAGTADPQVPVILVNESTGATATVLSKVDGSFATFVEANEEDFISAVFVNANGTRIEVPATMQRFDDGRVALYQQGGILEAESDGGPVQVLIEPKTIEERMKFRVDNVQLAQLFQVLQGSLPAEAQLLGGVRVAHEADKEVTEAADISFPLDRASLQLPPGVARAEDATFLLTSAMELEDGTVVYEIIDTMKVEGDRLVTKSPPYVGLLLKKVTDKIKSLSPSFKKLKTSNKILNALGLPGIQETLTHQLLLPFMMLVGHSTDIIGNVRVTQLDGNGLPVGDKKPVIGAVVALEQPPFLSAGKLRPGTFVASSRAPAGFFVLRVDTTFEGAQFQLAATHPRFPGQRASATGGVGKIAERFLQGDISQLELLFGIPPPSAVNLDPDTTPPPVRAEHTPQGPTAGLGANPGTTLNIVAFDDREMQSLSAVKLDVSPFGNQALDLQQDVELIEESMEMPTPDRIESRFKVRCLRAGRVTIAITATDAAGNITVQNHSVDFARPPLVPPVVGNDTMGPRVLVGWPPLNAINQAAFPDIRLRFSEALPAAAFTPGNTDWLTFASGHFVTAIEPSADRRDVVVRFAGSPSGPVSLTVGSPLTDEAGNAFDQNPDTSGNQPYNLAFQLAPAVQGTLDTVGGGGVVGDGVRAFALDRNGPSGGELVCYDLSDPMNPSRIGSLSLPSRPADLVYLPGYSLALTPGGSIVTRDLVVAVGGINGAPGFGDAAAAFKWMWVIDVTSASTPVRIASGNISQDVTSLVQKVAAAMPIVTYLETSGDVTALHFVDLPAFVQGHNATAAERALFPEIHQPGIDLNGDGDYADVGEKSSVPAKSPPLFFGEFFSFAPLEQTDRIVDFDFSPSGVASAVTFNTQTGNTIFHNVLAATGTIDPNEGTLQLIGDEAKRVFLVDGVRMSIGAGAPRLLNLGLVSLRSGAAAGPRVTVIDNTDPAHPVRIGDMPLESSDGIPQSFRLREDGLLALATTNDLLILDPIRLLSVDALGHSLAIVSRIPGLGGGVRGFVSQAAGLHVVNAGSKHISAFTGPLFELVTFPQAPQTADMLTTLSDDAKFALLQSAVPAPSLHRANINFTQPPTPQQPPMPSTPLAEDHYYVVCRMPGSATANFTTLPLVLETIDVAGTLPKVNATGTSIPAVVVDPTTLQQFTPAPAPGTNPPPPVFPLVTRAFRMSNNPGSPLFNVLLAGPVTFHTTINSSQATALTTQLPRTMLRVNKCLVVALPPKEGAMFFDPFRSMVSGQTIVPGANRIVPIDFERNPLILIPGMAGSKLEEDTVLPPTQLWPGWLFFQTSSHRKLSLDPADFVGGNPPADVVVSDALRTTALGLSSIYEPLIKSIKDHGYREFDYQLLPAALAAVQSFFEPFSHKYHENRVFPPTKPGVLAQIAQPPDFFVFPYDWRKDNVEAAAQLEDYVKLVKFFNPDADQVDIVAHSNGGLVARRYILNNPGVVGRCITLGTPFLGAPKAVPAINRGDGDEFIFNLLILPFELRKLSRHFLGTQQLLPGKDYFLTGLAPLVERGWDLNGNGNAVEDYNFMEYQRVFDEVLQDKRGLPPVANSQIYHGFTVPDGKQDDWRTDNTGVQYAHIYGLQSVPLTIGQVEARAVVRRVEKEVKDTALTLADLRSTDRDQVLTPPPLKLKPESYVVDHLLTYRRVKGDGTVPVVSAARRGNGLDLNAPGAVLLEARSESAADDKLSEHNGMLKNPKVQRWVNELLDGAIPQDGAPSLIPAFAAPGEASGAAPAPPVVSTYRVRVINVQRDSASVVGSTGHSSDGDVFTLGPGANLGIAGQLTSRIVQFLTGALEEEATADVAEFEFASNALDGPYTIKATATELPMGFDVTEEMEGQIIRRILHPGRLLSPGAAVSIVFNPATGAIVSVTPNGQQLGTMITLVGEDASSPNPPALQALFNDQHTTVEISRQDDTFTTAETTVLVGSAQSNDGDETILQPLDASGTATVDYSALDTRPMALVATDPAENVTSVQFLAKAGSKPPGTEFCDLLDMIREAISSSIDEALDGLEQDGWLLNADDIAILEQGSGACLWKPTPCMACGHVYTPKVSDHDLEVFLPVFVGPDPLDLFTDPYTPTNIEGDWYFKKPQDGGNVWIYPRPTPPGGQPLTPLMLPKAEAPDGPTPARFMTRILNFVAEHRFGVDGVDKPGLLPDISFFAVRKEHFENAQLDVLPPEGAGVDAMGDAGLGRQLLLLKWLLEGEYVQLMPAANREVEGANLDVIYALFKDPSKGVPRVDGHEWANLQLWSAFSAGVMLRPRLLDPGVEPGPNRGFVYEVTRKQLKKAGKAAMRGVIAAAAGFGNLTERTAFFTDLLATNRNNPETFEESVARVAAGHAQIFGSFAPRIPDFLLAKNNDDAFMDGIIPSEAETNKFLADVVNFLSLTLGNTLVEYSVEISTLSVTRPLEAALRQSNLAHLRAGIMPANPGPDDAVIPGLDDLINNTYLNVPLLLSNRGFGPIPGVTVNMHIFGLGGTMTTSTIVDLPADDNVVIAGRFANPLRPFFITMPLSERRPFNVSFTLDHPQMSSEFATYNNWADFDCHVLDLQNPTSTVGPVGPDETVLPPPAGVGSPFQVPVDFDPGFDVQMAAQKFAQFFPGKTLLSIQLVGSRTNGVTTGDIDISFITDEEIEHRDPRVFSLFKALNPAISGRFPATVVTFGNADRNLDYTERGPNDPQVHIEFISAPDTGQPVLTFIPKQGALDPSIDTIYSVGRPAIKVFPTP